MSHDIEVMRICVRRWLSEIKNAELRIRETEELIERIESRLALMGVSFYSGGSITFVNQDGRMVDGISRLEEARAKMCDILALVNDDILQAQELCLKNTSRMAVYKHYVDGESWDNVARMMGCSRRKVISDSRQGIIELYYAMPERWRREAIPNAMPN